MHQSPQCGVRKRRNNILSAPDAQPRPGGIERLRIRERLVLQFDGTGNVFNHPNFGNPTANISTSATAPRSPALGHHL
jgi:hypothetical protein